jgi:hypothetical protein
MYTKQEAAQIKRTFWTTLGQYLAPIEGADGYKVNWLNYKTGFKDLYFRMDADRTQASIQIEMMQSDADLRLLYYEQFMEVAPILQQIVGEDWEWRQDVYNDLGQPMSTIGAQLTPVNIYQSSDWPKMIAFLKPRMIALDEFWSVVSHRFTPLKSL